ncbi:unnamed protein product [Urochloa humidicola]
MQSKTLATPNAVQGVGSNQLGAPVARAPLLLRHNLAPLQQQQPLPANEARSFPWLPAAGFAYLTLSSGMALRRCWGDPGATAFIALAYAALLLLFFCLRLYERADPGSALREWLKLAVWLLTSALTLAFSYKVAAAMPAAAAAIVWVTGAATICGGFLALFCLKKTT